MLPQLHDVAQLTSVLVFDLARWDVKRRINRCGTESVAEPDIPELRREVALRAFTWMELDVGEREVVRVPGSREPRIVNLSEEPEARALEAVRFACAASLRDVRSACRSGAWSTDEPVQKCGHSRSPA